MNKLLITFFCFATLGCASPVASPQAQSNRLIRIAKKEIDRRQIRLPSDCAIRIIEGVTVSQVRKPREEHIVQFVCTFGGKRDVIYAVAIGKHSGKIVGFMDYRDTL